MVNKARLYWLMQIGGWALYAAVQIGVAVVSVGTISTQRVIFLTYEAFFCFILTHLFRTYMNNNRWLSWGMPRLIPRVLLAVWLLGVVMYFLRIPVSLPLGLFSQSVVFDPKNILGLITRLRFFLFFMVCLLFYL
jgi:two-component system LytT family sensor kinase